MIKKVFLVLFFVFSGLQFVQSQEKHPFILPAEVYKQAQICTDSGWYDKAIDLLKTIDPSDTSYVDALTELASNYLAAKKYAQSIETANQALSYKSSSCIRLTLIKGNSFDDWGCPDSTIVLYKQALITYPFHYLLHYNLGITYLNQKQYEFAVTSFQEAILCNPFHASSHLALGRTMALMGQYVHAMLSIETFLMIEPNSHRSNNNLVFINDFVNNALSDGFERIPPVIGNSAFEETDLILKARIALNKGYKAKIKFDAPIAKQAQLLFESLHYTPNTNDFWMNYYVPVFLEVNKNKHIENFLYVLLSSVPSKDIAKQLKKRRKDIISMNKILSLAYDKFHLQRKIKTDGIDVVADFNLNNTNGLLSIGNYGADGKTRIGKWQYYFRNGELNAKGGYNDTGKLDGIWFTYNQKGQLTESETYQNGLLQGENISYYESGRPRYKATYINNHVEGVVNYFFDCDAISSTVHFENGKRNGPGISYFKNGVVREEYSYVNDSLQGLNKGYYPNGSLKWTNNFEKGKLNGTSVSFFKNGIIEEAIDYVHSLYHGAYKAYYLNGTLKKECFYKNGKLTGLSKEYFENGKLNEIMSYNDKGKVEGTTTDFDLDGLGYYTAQYADGKIREYTWKDKRGEIIDTKQLGKGIEQGKGYSPDGKLCSEGSYIAGITSGNWKYYDQSGRKLNEKNFSNGTLNGPFLTYHPSRNKEVVKNFKDGVLDGYYQIFFNNGKVSSEGWYVDGKQEGKWYFWNFDGGLNETIFYLYGNENGFLDAYAPDGKLQFKTGYKKGEVTSFCAFDSTGKKISDITFDGTKDYLLYDFHGKVRGQADYNCNEFNNKLCFFTPQGKIDSEYTLLHNVKEGPFISFFSDGKIAKEGFYENNKKSGHWKYFSKNGGIVNEGNFIGNTMDSVWTKYYSNGKLASKITYKEDLVIDTSSFFDSKDNFMYALVYNEKGFLTGYFDKNLIGSSVKNISLTDSGCLQTFYANGNISSKQCYVRGILQGKQLIYFNNGKVSKEYFLDNKDLEGNYTEYYENGQIKSVEPYRLNQNHGTNLYYFINGRLEHSEEYRYNSMHGAFKYYDESGNLKTTHHYWGGIFLD